MICSPERRPAGSGQDALRLIPFDLPAAQEAAAGCGRFLEGHLPAETKAHLIAVAGAQAALYGRVGAEPPWIGYVGVDARTSRYVGVCSFKGPCREGMAEIAYFTFPAYESQGWGRRLAAALIAIGWSEPQLMSILAHTLPQENASTRILRRLGFQLVGPVQDPEDGVVWQWQLERPSGSAASCTS